MRFQNIFIAAFFATSAVAQIFTAPIASSVTIAEGVIIPTYTALPTVSASWEQSASRKTSTVTVHKSRVSASRLPIASSYSRLSRASYGFSSGGIVGSVGSSSSSPTSTSYNVPSPTPTPSMATDGTHKNDAVAHAQNGLVTLALLAAGVMFAL